MSTNPQPHELTSWPLHTFGTNCQLQGTPLSSSKGIQSSKRLITKACRQVLENPFSSQKEKLQAASILEKVMRLRELATARKRRTKAAKKANSSEPDRLRELLEHAS